MGSYYGSSSESCRGERWGRGGTAVAAICARHYQENTFHWPPSCSLTSMFKSLSPAGSAHISFLSLSLPPSLTHIDTPYQPSQDTSSFFSPFTFCHRSIGSASVLFIPSRFDSKCSALLISDGLDSGQSSRS